MLIAKDALAQRLIAAWPNVDRSGREDEIIQRWARMAGARPNEVVHKWAMLVGNGFVKMDGTVDPIAEAYVRSLAVAMVAKNSRPRRAPEQQPPHAPSKEDKL